MIRIIRDAINTADEGLFFSWLADSLTESGWRNMPAARVIHSLTKLFL